MGFEQDWHDLVADTDPALDIGIAVGALDGSFWTGGRDLLFPACSISKHVAAFGTLRLVAEATIDLDVSRAAAGRSALLPPDLVTQMLTPAVPGGFGLGTEVADGRFGHTGQNTGFSCFSFAWPASGRAVAAMTNAEDCADILAALVDLAERHFG